MSRSFIMNLLALASVISQAAASTILATIPAPEVVNKNWPPR
ncbi:hypothetical protein [Yersinia kristensenii]|nr:hypothetical protein [Yersinia kristensenii]